jgi:hypothetical protein
LVDVDIEKIQISEDFDFKMERESDINLLSSVSKSRHHKGSLSMAFYKTQSVIISSQAQEDYLCENLLDEAQDTHMEEGQELLTDLVDEEDLE